MGMFKSSGRVFGAMVVLALLASCGGSDSEIASDCSIAGQKTWLRSYMQDWYYWTGRSPNPEPEGYDTVANYFKALLFTGDAALPHADKWSYISDSAAFTQFFGDGKTLGYGIFVNGIEQEALNAAGQPLTGLKVRFIEAASPAALLLQRGDTIVSINGHSAAEMVAAGDYHLSPAAAGESLSVVIDNGGGAQTVNLVSAVYTLTPVNSAQVLALPNGTNAGYLVLKDFISQAEVPLRQAFSDFRTQNATELILDLRYNGGGLISTSTVLASLVAGVSRNGAPFTTLRHNSGHTADNYTYTFGGATSATGGFSRVIVLTGSRTCSASELVVNGLKPYVDVDTIGGTTCGKPFGFRPRDNCSSTYSAVNFESVNALSNGQYYDGITASCPAGDGFSGVLGDPVNESLTHAASTYLQSGACPVAVADPRQRAQSVRDPAAGVRARTTEPGEHPGMWVD